MKYITELSFHWLRIGAALAVSHLAGFRFTGDDESRGKGDQTAGKLWTEAKSISFSQHILVFMMLKVKVKQLNEAAWKFAGSAAKTEWKVVC